ncbi:MAG: UdgX family uracil-DNA binding protein [Candidatus Eremiobacteraeota bacterium]|nr:UdgX family uracil-DNA binding protein [Candidatus Eremiobacteraeota bacterium]MBV8332250.1 UdgX family uracil-DNA binding protein [Candidatus Eremiobacteraeota bacterium]
MDGRSAARYLPERLSLKSLREAAAHCRGCDLYKAATQTVFGEGPRRARVMFVGEQPGDSEDRLGHPFVGPAGRVLHEAMDRAGIALADAYVTNAVKHFKFELRGKRRIHKTPKTVELRACEPWLGAELAVVKPRVLVPLGATAAKALLGPKFRLLAGRGRPVAGSTLAAVVIPTVHPSSILRAPDSAARHRDMGKFVEDLEAVAAALSNDLASTPPP